MTETFNNEGIRCYEAKRCILCVEQGEKLYSNLRDRLFSAPGKWEFWVCRQCEVLWLNPRPCDEDIPKLYENYYTHEGFEGKTNFLKSVVRNTFVKHKLGYKLEPRLDFAGKIVSFLVEFFLPHTADSILKRYSFLSAGDGRKILDVGCGNGEFLLNMKALGWEVWGVEPDEKSCEVARKNGLTRIICKPFQEADLPEGYFDAVTLRHVIEHFTDPEGALRKVLKVLKKGGKVVVITPNIKSFLHFVFKESWRGLEPPRHLYLFSPKSIRVLCEKEGFLTERVFSSPAMVLGIWKQSLEIFMKGNSSYPFRITLPDKVLGLAIAHLERILSFRNLGEELIYVGIKA